MNFTNLLAFIEEDLLNVNEELIKNTKSNTPLINDISTYIIKSGGKRIRPILTLLFSKLLEVDSDKAIKIAVATELIHTATILHDDVVDNSSMRRGIPTANKKYNNPAAVLVGDFIYTRAFQIIAQFNNPSLMKLYTDAVNIIAEGEVKQFSNLGDLSINEEKYFDVIYSKTARLFEVCCHAIAMLKYPEDYDKQLKLAKYGTYLGTGFQIVDDIIDYKVDTETSGKNPGDDLAEGKPTLPLLRLREVGTREDKILVEEIILQKRSIESFNEVLQRLEANNCFAYCEELATKEIQKARKSIKDCKNSQAKDFLIYLTDLALQRKN